MSGLTVLASYPKSGNTWMRAFLASLAKGGDTPDINAELAAHVLARRGALDAWIGVEASDLTPAEIATIRPYASRRAAAAGAGVVKVHDANLVPPGGREPPIPADAIDRVIYIVRDPRDVAVSSAHHFGKTAEAIVAEMNDPEFAIGRSQGHLNRNVDQYISTWSRHVESWLDADGLRVHRVRYEDMVAAPEPTFAAAARFLELEHSDEAIALAVQAVAFGKLAEQEARRGFVERLAGAVSPFFRRGKPGGWRIELAPPLAAQIEREHGVVMRRCGYLD